MKISQKNIMTSGILNGLVSQQIIQFSQEQNQSFTNYSKFSVTQMTLCTWPTADWKALNPAHDQEFLIVILDIWKIVHVSLGCDETCKYETASLYD